jgi:hypothetical protein
MATGTDAIARGALAAGVAADVADAAPDAAVVAEVVEDPQALAFPKASPATTQGVVSELICMLLPGGW